MASSSGDTATCASSCSSPLLARNQAFDVVLVDTAGRMQDNAPLMTALAKLIAVNMPDLVLFVGEALVGNEAVDQLVRPSVSNSVNLEVVSDTEVLLGKVHYILVSSI